MNKCPVFDSADMFGKKWTIPLIQEIFLNGNKGFNSIFKCMKKITPKLLSTRLKEFEDKGIVERKVLSDRIPVRTSYVLTEKGREFQEMIVLLKKWNIKYSNCPIDCDKRKCVDCPLYH